jgi:hypothetical protein
MLADDRVSDANRHEDISRVVDCSLVATAEEDRLNIWRAQFATRLFAA